MAVAETTDLLHQLHAAFLEVGGGARGLLVKFHGGLPASLDELRRDGLHADRLEGGGRLFYFAEDPDEERTDALRRVLEEARVGRTIWAAFNWTERVGVDRALERRRARTSHSATISLSEPGPSLSRVTPLSPGR